MVPAVSVPNIDDPDELAYHISIMFYITAGVATLLFILVLIGKVISRFKGSVGTEGGSADLGEDLMNMTLEYHSRYLVFYKMYLQKLEAGLLTVFQSCSLSYCSYSASWSCVPC